MIIIALCMHIKSSKAMNISIIASDFSTNSNFYHFFQFALRGNLHFDNELLWQWKIGIFKYTSIMDKKNIFKEMKETKSKRCELFKWADVCGSKPIAIRFFHCFVCVCTKWSVCVIFSLFFLNSFILIN